MSPYFEYINRWYTGLTSNYNWRLVIVKWSKWFYKTRYGKLRWSVSKLKVAIGILIWHDGICKIAGGIHKSREGKVRASVGYFNSRSRQLKACNGKTNCSEEKLNTWRVFVMGRKNTGNWESNFFFLSQESGYVLCLHSRFAQASLCCSLGLRSLYARLRLAPLNSGYSAPSLVASLWFFAWCNKRFLKYYSENK